MPITAELRRITEEREVLSLEEAAALMRRILAGEAADVEIAALTGALAARGEAASEIAGFALAMREAASTLPLTEAEKSQVVDTCGTGGDGSGTFNISTAAALVAAAAGAKVAKHGNRAVTSRCGSADVLEALGIPTQLSPEQAAEALRRHNFCFLLAPAHHPAMRAVMSVRRALGVRTIFNVLGPLLNPAGARRQVMGVYSAHLVPLVAEAMQLLGTMHAFVVHGAGGMDEFSLSGPSTVAEVRADFTHGGAHVRQVSPADLGLSEVPVSALAGGGPQENAAILGGVFGLYGEPPASSPQRNVVLLNAAAVLITAGLAADLPHGLQLAAEAIDSRAVASLVQAIRTP